MSDPIRIAFFGNGFARKVMLPCLRQVEGTRLVGIASPNLERARSTAEEFGIDFASDDHREILDRTDPDLVFVVTPTHRHMEQSIDALNSGCHVVCEKPTAMTAEESATMLAAARTRSDRLALIDHELRFDPKRRQLRTWVENGDLGEVDHATYTVFSPSRRDPDLAWNWWCDAARGGGALGAIGSHAIDALRVILGEVDSVRGNLQTLVKDRPDPSTGTRRLVTSDDYAAAWLRFRNGALATLTISMVEPERLHRITLSGSRGSARLDEQGPLLASFDGGRMEEIEIEEELPPNEDLGIPDTDWARNFLRYSRRIVDSIRDGRSEVEGAADFEDGHRNQMVLDAIRRSAESEGWITV